jgi:Beta-lactamase enzyme family
MPHRGPSTCAVALVLVLAGAIAAPAGAAAWRPDVEAARAFAAHRAGTVAFAVRMPRHLWGVHLDRRFPSASVVKAMLLVAYLRSRPVRGRPLRAADRALLSPMIRRSDNVAATRVRDIVGSAALERLARRVGMTRFHANPVWGFSTITARDQTRYFLHIDRWMPARHRRYGMRLLRTVVPSQRWGIARVVPPGWTIAFKGGWGAGTGAVDHQVALLRRGAERVSIAVLTVGSPSHAYGKASERGVARRLLRGLSAPLAHARRHRHARGAGASDLEQRVEGLRVGHPAAARHHVRDR